MKNKFYFMEKFLNFNATKLADLLEKTTESELKLFLILTLYLLKKDKKVFGNSVQFRSTCSSMGFKRTSVSLSNLLSSLVSKDVLQREMKGIYSINKEWDLLEQK